MVTNRGNAGCDSRRSSELPRSYPQHSNRSNLVHADHGGYSVKNPGIQGHFDVNGAGYEQITNRLDLPGGQGVVGSNPAIPTSFRILILLRATHELPKRTPYRSVNKRNMSDCRPVSHGTDPYVWEGSYV